MPLLSVRSAAVVLFTLTAIAGPLSANEGNPAAGTFTPVRIPNLSGTWRGSWISDTNGHRGPLRARFRQLDAHRYRVRFGGRFWMIFPFRYTTVLSVSGYGPDRVYLTGRHPLGPVWGTFSFNGQATQTHFSAVYNSRRDHGRFMMTRRR